MKTPTAVTGKHIFPPNNVKAQISNKYQMT
jgi:hypothetical protein